MTTYTSFDLVEFSQPPGTSIKRPWRDSNPRTRLRRPMLYPLSYRGWDGSGYRPGSRARPAMDGGQSRVTITARSPVGLRPRSRPAALASQTPTYWIPYFRRMAVRTSR